MYCLFKLVTILHESHVSCSKEASTRRTMSITFGTEAKQTYFPSHKPDFIRLNHGSFGAAPVSIVEAKKAYEEQWNSQPDDFYFNGLSDELKKSTEAVADFVNCAVDNLCMVDNATTGAVMVAQYIGHEFSKGLCKPGDVILLHSFIYAAVAKLFKYYTETLGAELVEVDLPFPISGPGDVLDAYKKTLDTLSGRRIRLAVVDHISSIPSVVFPLKDINALLRERGAEEIFIDGAHAIGAISLDLQAIDCDYYTSNCHKWLFCPTSVGFFYFRDVEKGHAALHHPIISHNYGQGLWAESAWIGTRDYSSLLTVPKAIDFVKSLGVEKVMAYNHDLVWKAAVKMTMGWGTRIGAPESMVSTLSLIELPQALTTKFDDMLKLRAHIRDHYNIECFPFLHKNGRFWIRLSAQIYNSEGDYDALYEAINKIVESCT